MKAVSRVLTRSVIRWAAAGLLWVGGSALFGWGFGLAFLSDPAPWKGAAAFGLWGLSTLFVAGALRLAGFWRKEG